MRKTIFCLAVGILVLLVSTSLCPAQNKGVRVMKQQERYTLSIALEFTKKNPNIAQRVLSVLTETDPNAFATGFVVGDGLVMTAYHVVSGRLTDYKRHILGFKPDDELDVKVYVNGCPAKIVSVDKDADLALLTVCSGSKRERSPEFNTTPEKNDRILVIAKPRTSKFLRQGVFDGLYTFHGNQYWSIKVDALDGFSGSPVYNEQGEVVGVFCGYDPSLGIAFISPSVKVRKLLDEYYANKS